MTEKIYLGRSSDGERLSIERHEWQCGWYWAFGYIGNQRLHMHIKALIEHPESYDNEWTDVTHHFSETWINQEQWWILRDLFISAYALKEAAAVYRHGGRQTELATKYRITSDERAKQINADLEKLLCNIWELLTKWRQS